MNPFKKIRRNIEKAVQRLAGTHPSFNPDYSGDGLGVNGRNLAFMEEAGFAAAWSAVKAFNKPFWPSVPDIRWRAHTCVWAARQALWRPGNFVELGVNTGILSSMVCKCLDFGTHTGRRFFLFDTFSGIEAEAASEHEAGNIARLNAAHFTRDVYEVAKRAFAAVPNAELVRGRLPGSLAGIETGPIAYLSIDLNSVEPEIASAEMLWPRLVPGAVIVLDDYAFAGHEAQQIAWDAFAATKGLSILTLPTGQGLIVMV